MRIEQLTFTRFIAALLIVIFHYGTDIFPFNLTGKMFLGGSVAVSYFFILSGFVMILAYHNHKRVSFINYLKNRFARIYPLYLLASLMLIGFFVYDSKVAVKLQDVFLNVFMIQSWVPGKALTLNFPSWSLSVELFFYICFPFLFNLLYRRFSYQKLLLPFILFFGLTQVVFIFLLQSQLYQGPHTGSHDLLFYFPLVHLSQFLLGNLAGLYFISTKNRKQRNNSIYILLLIVVCGLILSFDNTFKYHNGLLAFIFIPLILLISNDNGWISKLCNKKLMIYLGKISYGVYILQIPVFVIFKKILKNLDIQDNTFIFYSSLIVLLVFSSITYQYIEAPLRKKIKSITLAPSKR